MYPGVIYHILVKVVDKYGRRDGDKRTARHVCWAVHKKRMKTDWMCACVGKGVCGPNSDREFFEIYLGNRQRASAPENSGESGGAAPQTAQRTRGSR
jgi:hypothetical protein